MRLRRTAPRGNISTLSSSLAHFASPLIETKDSIWPLIFVFLQCRPVGSYRHLADSSRHYSLDSAHERRSNERHPSRISDPARPVSPCAPLTVRIISGKEPPDENVVLRTRIPHSADRMTSLAWHCPSHSTNDFATNATTGHSPDVRIP